MSATESASTVDVSVVVPVYNESESLPELMRGIAETFSALGKSFEVVFVDDGSADDSFDVIKSLHKEYDVAGKILPVGYDLDLDKLPATHGAVADVFPKDYNARVRAIRFSRNCGKSAALSAGIGYATGEVIVTMDADLQDDPAAIPEMIAKLDEGWDVVSGWKKVRHDPFGKTFPSRIWNFMTSVVSGLRLHDFNCGFKAYRAGAAKNLDIYGERHRYLPALAHWDGCQVTEIPVPHHPRKFGKSKYGAWRMFNGAMDMITLLFLKRYMKSPMHFFGMLGVLLILIGTGILGYFGVMWAITGVMRIRPLTLLAVGSLIMGIQFMSIGLIGEMITNSSHSRRQYTVRERL